MEAGDPRIPEDVRRVQGIDLTFVGACLQVITWATTLERLKDIGQRISKTEGVGEREKDILRKACVERAKEIRESDWRLSEKGIPIQGSFGRCTVHVDHNQRREQGAAGKVDHAQDRKAAAPTREPVRSHPVPTQRRVARSLWDEDD